MEGIEWLARKCDHIDKNVLTLILFYFPTNTKGPVRTWSTHNIVKMLYVWPNELYLFMKS